MKKIVDVIYKYRKIIILVLGIILIYLLINLLMPTSGNRSTPNDGEEESLEISSSSEEQTESTTEVETEPETEPVVYVYKKILTGEGTNEENKARPLIVSYDNLHKAWPQSGISSADIGIEILAEGRITRILGVFYSEFPEKFGPIRSARPYMLDKVLEFDSYFAHVGGSMQALSDIKTYNIADLDGMHSGAFKRYPPKNPPHNTYALYQDLLAQAKEYKYRTEVQPTFLEFNSDFKVEGENAKSIEILYRSPGVYGDEGYKVRFDYNEEEQKYERFMNDKPHIDALNEEQVTCTNILVQVCNHQVIDQDGRLKIDLIGSGKGYYITGGKAISVTWKKDGKGERTHYFDPENNEIKLNVGKTWIMIISNPDSLKFLSEQEGAE